MRQEKSCGALTYRALGGARRVLVIRHRHGGHWAFPKGHVEPGESERETAARETMEETGASVRFLDGFRETTHYSPARGVNKEVVYFLAEYEGGALRPQPEEVAEARFVPPADARRMLTFEADRTLLDRAEAFLNARAGRAGC